jgi:hypothetical protein
VRIRPLLHGGSGVILRQRDAEFGVLGMGLGIGSWRRFGDTFEVRILCDFERDEPALAFQKERV